MKKQITKALHTLVPALGISFALCACGNSPSENGNNNLENNTPAASSENRPSAASDHSEGVSNDNETKTDTLNQSSLSSLCNLQYGDTACVSNDGYYYLSNDFTTLTDGRLASHLMYMDFAARQEIYLCSNTACSHNTTDCTSVVLNDDFPPYSTLLFIWNENLYLLSKEQDSDGNMASVSASIVSAPESKPTILYQANLDGTDRKEIYAFDHTVTVEDFVIGDERGLYFITKKVTTQQSSQNSYHTSSERELICLDLSGQTQKTICSMQFGDNISWDVIGCSERFLVLYGVDFGRELSPEELHAEDPVIYDDSYDVFATLDIDSGSFIEIYRVYAPKSRSFAVDENNLYFSVDGSSSIMSVDLRTREETVLCNMTKNLIAGQIKDNLYCYDSSDHTYYFVDVNTGEISHSGLVNKTTGWSLAIIAETGDQVLVNYDSDGSFNSNGSFTSTREHFGLIDKKDLLAGIDNFIPITTAGKDMR